MMAKDVHSAERIGYSMANKPSNPLPDGTKGLGDSEGLFMTIMKNFGVSCMSASFVHILHHPLYTLKSQMMFYGKDFRWKTFISRTMITKGTFLFQKKKKKNYM